jgi:4-hydroxy-tetrahydrodipicolinate synthase
MQETGLAWYSGDDVLNLGWLTHGAAGVVSVVGHVAGRQYAEMAAAVDAGDLPTARALNAQLLPAVVAIMTRLQGAVMVKAALQLAGALSHRTVRLPLVEATDDQVDALRADLEGARLL